MEIKDEFKEEEATLEIPAQDEKSLEEELSLEEPETVESLRARLAKAEEERENYKNGMLKYKKQAKEVDGEEEEVDVKTVAEQTVHSVLAKSNEKTAIAQFTEQYPALKDPETWKKVVENYVPRSGKDSVESVKKDLEAALVLARHYGGGKVAEKEITLNQFASVSYAGSIAPHSGTPQVSESAVEMGRRLGVSVEDLEKASQPGGNEIQIA